MCVYTMRAGVSEECRRAERIKRTFLLGGGLFYRPAGINVTVLRRKAFAVVLVHRERERNVFNRSVYIQWYIS